MALFCALSCPVLSCPRTLPAACRTGRLAALPGQFVTRISPDARALCQASRTSEVLQAPGQPCRRPVPGPFCAPFSGTGREVRRIQGAHPRHDSLVTASLPHVLRAQTSSFQLPCIAFFFHPGSQGVRSIAPHALSGAEICHLFPFDAQCAGIPSCPPRHCFSIIRIAPPCPAQLSACAPGVRPPLRTTGGLPSGALPLPPPTFPASPSPASFPTSKVQPS